MRYLTAVLIGFVGIQSLSQASSREETEQAAIVEFAQKAVVRALNYNQGDRQSLIDAQDDFTGDGWNEFMKRMEGWLDSKGAPLRSSNFMPSGDAVITDQEHGLMHLTIPGVLKQSENKSTTTYRLVVDVRLAGDPVKIAHLEPIVRLSK